MRGYIACMSECPEVCGQEAAGLENYPSELVADNEWVCRTVRPAEYKTKNSLKAAFIQTSKLRAGELSAWRLHDPAQLPELEAKLVAGGNPPDNIIAAQARDLRRIAIQDRLRSVSVINDTRIDDAGNHDPQHVTIAPCAQLMAAADPDEITSEIKAQLLLVFRSQRAQALKQVPEK